MTATATLPAAGAPAPAGPPPKPRSRRWIRLVLPVGIVAFVVLVSAFAYVLQQPDQKNHDYLSPTRGRSFGAERLAGLLKQRGIAIERLTRTSDALVSAQSGDATLFVPTPDLVHPFYLRMLKLLPA